MDEYGRVEFRIVTLLVIEARGREVLVTHEYEIFR